MTDLPLIQLALWFAFGCFGFGHLDFGERQVGTHRVHIGDHGRAVFDAGKPREAHLGAVGEGARALQPLVEILEGPVAAMVGECGRIGKARFMRRDRQADHAIEIGSDTAGAALVDRVAGNALGEHLLALGDIRRSETHGNRSNVLGGGLLLGDLSTPELMQAALSAALALFCSAVFVWGLGLPILLFGPWVKFW